VLSDRATLEDMIRRTGGIEVRIGSEDTWGHLKRGYVNPDDRPRVLTPRTGVKVPAEVVPEEPIGVAVTVAGADWTIDDVDVEEDDGAMLVLVLKRA